MNFCRHPAFPAIFPFFIFRARRCTVDLDLAENTGALWLQDEVEKFVPAMSSTSRMKASMLEAYSNTAPLPAKHGARWPGSGTRTGPRGPIAWTPVRMTCWPACPSPVSTTPNAVFALG